MSPNGKIAFITGANKGIGLETSRQLAHLGFTVLMGCRETEKGVAAIQQIQQPGLDLQMIKIDTTIESDRQAAVKQIESQFGKLDVLINNAAVALDRGVAPSAVSQDILHRTFEANFFSVVALTQTLLPLIRKSEAGRIVNLSSNLASLTKHCDPASDTYNVKILAYNASKTAINAFTVHLAHELRDTSIKVNSAHPGWVKTSMGGVHAPMEIVDGAKTSVRLATLPADGPTGGFFFMDETIPW